MIDQMSTQKIMPTTTDKGITIFTPVMRRVAAGAPRLFANAPRAGNGTTPDKVE